MLRFEFNDQSLVSKDGSVVAGLDGECTLLDEHDGRKGVVQLNQGCITVHEQRIGYQPQSFAMSVGFKLEACAQRTEFIKGTSIPIVISAVPSDKGAYVIQLAVQVQGQWHRVQSEVRVDLHKWYDLRVVLLDGQFICYMNDIPVARRVFKGEATALAATRASNTLRIGSNDQAFNGYVDAITFHIDVAQEREKARHLEDEGFMEIESKYDDMRLAGIDLGKCLSNNNGISEHTEARYSTYKKGVIFWSYGYKAVWISKRIFDTYFELIHEIVLGLPVADDRQVKNANGSICLFENGALYHNRESDAVIHLNRNILLAFKDSGLDESDWGGPTGPLESREYNVGNVSCMYFTNKVVVVSTFPNGDETTHALDFEEADLYLSYVDENGLLKLVYSGFNGSITNEVAGAQENYEVNYLVCSKVVVCLIKGKTQTSDGQIRYLSKHFPVPTKIFEFFVQQEGINERAYFGKYKFPVDEAIKLSDGTCYMDFHGGVIVEYPSNKGVYGFSDIKIVLSSIIAGKIYDPPNRVAELYITVSLYVDDILIEDNKRWPDYSSAKHGGSSFSIIYSGNAVNKDHPAGTNVYYTVPKVRGNSAIRLVVKAYDYDPGSKNDYLGTFDYKFDVSTGWGLIEDALGDENRLSYNQSNSRIQAIYEQAYLTNQGKDNRGGYKNIRLSFRIERDKREVDLLQSFRKYGYWSINNYGATTELSRSIYNSVFNASTARVIDRIFNPIDELWFILMVKGVANGKGGQCFGLSLEALYAINGASPYTVPLDEWNLYADKRAKPSLITNDTDVDPGFAARIRAKHLYQVGWQHITMVVRKGLAGDVLIGGSAFNDIKHMIKEDGCCLIHLVGGGAHTVLGYKVSGDRIYIADSNNPWWRDTSENKGGDGSFIELTYETGKQVELVSNIKKRYNFFYGTPYAVVCNEPRCPALIDIVNFALEIVVSIVPALIINFIKWAAYFIVGKIKVMMEEFPRAGAAEQITIPISNDDWKYSVDEGSGFTIIRAVADAPMSFKVFGTPGEDYTCFAITRGQVLTVKSKLGDSGQDLVKFEPLTQFRNQVSVVPVPVCHSGDGSDGNVAPIEEISVPNSSALITSAPLFIKYGVDAPEDVFEYAVAAEKTTKPYYVNRRKQSSGEHEMHVYDCEGLPIEKNRIFLGEFENEADALRAAKAIYPNSNGCSMCCKDTDTDHRQTSDN